MTAFAPLLIISGLAFTRVRGASTRANLEEEAAKVRAGILSTWLKRIQWRWCGMGIESGLEIAGWQYPKSGIF